MMPETIEAAHHSLELALQELEIVKQKLEAAKELRAESEVLLENSKTRLKTEQDRGVALRENLNRSLKITQIWFAFFIKIIFCLLLGAFIWVLITVPFKLWLGSS